MASNDSLANNGAKKADVAEHPKVFHHVGLLVNEPPAAAGCSLYSQPKTSLQIQRAARGSFTRAAFRVFCYHYYKGIIGRTQSLSTPVHRQVGCT